MGKKSSCRRQHTEWSIHMISKACKSKWFIVIQTYMQTIMKIKNTYEGERNNNPKVMIMFYFLKWCEHECWLYENSLYLTHASCSLLFSQYLIKPIF